MRHILPLLLLSFLAFLTACQSSEQIYETQTRDIRILADDIDHNVPLTRTIPMAVASHVTSNVEVFGNLDQPARIRWNWEFNNHRTVKNYYYKDGIIILYTYQSYPLPAPEGIPARYTIASKDYDNAVYFTDAKSRSREQFPEGDMAARILRQTRADYVKP
jgi:hypothetical protein